MSRWKVFSRPMLSFQVSLEDVAFDDLVSSVSYKSCNIFDLRRIPVLLCFLICQRVWKRDENIKWRITLFCTNFLQLLMKTHFDPHVKLLGINGKFQHCKECLCLSLNPFVSQVVFNAIYPFHGKSHFELSPRFSANIRLSVCAAPVHVRLCSWGERSSLTESQLVRNTNNTPTNPMIISPSSCS